MEEKLSKKLAEVVSWLQKEFTGIRTGQAAPAILDNIKVESYGTTVNLQQVSSVSIEDARTLRLSLWDASQSAAVEKAIRDADLGVSLVVDSGGFRVIFPELTSDRRQQLLKIAGSKQEDARVSVRSARDEVMKQIEADKKSGVISEDEAFIRKEKVQKLIENANKELEQLLKNKEKEISL